jgi:hypothetical protein
MLSVRALMVSKIFEKKLATQKSAKQRIIYKNYGDKLKIS